MYLILLIKITHIYIKFKSLINVVYEKCYGILVQLLLFSHKTVVDTKLVWKHLSITNNLIPISISKMRFFLT